MKGKLLFTAALMAEAVTVTQAVRTGNGSMFWQLPEEGTTETTEAAPDAPEADKVRPETDSTDVTGWIVNPSFDENADGWSCDGAAPAWVDGHLESLSNAWNKPTFDFYQEMELPSGVYSLSVQEHATIGDRTELYIQSSMERSAVTMNWNNGDLAAWADETVSRVSTGEVLVTDGKLRIGVRLHTAHQNLALYFDNFKLLYVNDGLERMQALYEDLQAQVGEVADYPEPLQERAAAAKAGTTVTADNFQEKYEWLAAEVAVLNSTAVEDFKQVSAMCSSFAATLEDGEVKAALTEALDEALAALATAETAEEVAQISGTLNTTFQTVTEGMEITYVVAETDFADAASAEGWNGAGTVADGVMEFFNTDFDFSREFTSLPEGWYQVTLNGFYRNGAADQGASYEAKAYTNGWRIYGNAYELPLMCLYEETGTTGFIAGEAGAEDGDYPGGRQSAAANFEAGRYADTLNVWVADHVLKVGVKGAGTDASRWACLDNVKLTYKGMDAQGLYEALAKRAVADAAGVNDAYRAKVEEAVAAHRPAGGGSYAGQNADSLNAVMLGCVELENALAQFGIDGVMADYEAKRDAALEGSTAPEEAVEALRNSLTDAENALAAVTGVADVEAVREALREAYVAYVKAAAPLDGHRLDLTLLLHTPDVAGLPKAAVSSFGWVSCTDSWSNNFANGDGPSEFFESYQNGAFEAGTWVLSQTVALPAGSYEMTLRAFGMSANGAGSGPLAASVYAGEAKGEAVADGNSLDTEYKVGFVVAADGEIQLGVKADEGNGANWVACNDMKLYKVAPEAQALTLDETVPFAVAADMYADVTLKRTMEAGDGWNVFCVPFSLTAAQLEANHITDVRRMEAQAVVAGNEVTLQFSGKQDAVEAGVPYLVRVDDGYTGVITAEDVPVVAAAPSAVFATPGISMQGHYSTLNVPLDAYYTHVGGFYKAATAGAVEGESDVEQDGYRAYITVDDWSPAAGIGRLLVNIDGVVTEIGEVLAGEAAGADRPVDVYTLGGVKVKAGVKKSEALDGLRHGIYIVDGKKVVL